MPLSNKHRTRSEECGLYSRIIRKKLGTTLQSTPSRQLRFYLSKNSETLELQRAVLPTTLQTCHIFLCFFGLWVQHHLPNPSPVFVKRENKKVAFQTQSSTLTITGAPHCHIDQAA